MRHAIAAALLVGLTFAARPAAAASEAEVNAAVERGRSYLEGRIDAATGTVRCHWSNEGYATGETALALLTLLKAGTPPDDPRIDRGFTWLLEQPLQRVYCVSTAILALEARYMPEEKKSIEDDEPLHTQIRRRFKKIAPPRDRRWLAGAVEFLAAHQDPSGMWRYPFYGDADVSNAQFAILALKAATRMGAKVPTQVFLDAALSMIQLQEQQGPEVAPFAVPAADRAIQGLHDRRSKRKKKRSSASGSGTRVRDADEGPETRTHVRMQARGWGYKPGAAPRGSMTAAALAILVVCKSELEHSKGYAEKLGPQVDRALRDGAAWLASRFSVEANPGAELDWYFYYLYTLERAGTLLALNTFGQRSWYDEGAAAILRRQQGDGRFHHDTSGQGDGDLAGHCLALLFLERSTVPVMKRPMTGGGAQHGPQTGAGTGGPQVTRAGDGQLQVTFRYRGTPGRRVTVAGSFNGWNADANPLADADGDGVYELTVTVPAGRHTYKFVVDGHSWNADPDNPRSEPDGHGGHNSVLEASVS